jgi:hypothetical protein
MQLLDLVPLQSHGNKKQLSLSFLYRPVSINHLVHPISLLFYLLPSPISVPPHCPLMHFRLLEECRLPGCYTGRLIRADVSEERITSIIRAIGIGELGPP